MARSSVGNQSVLARLFIGFVHFSKVFMKNEQTK